MKNTTTSQQALASRNDLRGAVAGAWEAVGQSFDQFCLLAGVYALSEMLESDASELAGEAHARNADKSGHRWGTTRGRLGFQGGKVELERPRVRSKATGKEMPLPSWQEAAEAGWLDEWADPANEATPRTGLSCLPRHHPPGQASRPGAPGGGV